MTRQALQVDGLADLNKALLGLRQEFDLSRATARNTMKRAMKDASAPIADVAREKAPRDWGDLADSIEITDKLSRRQKAKHYRQSGVELFVGAQALPHAHLQEFGTAFHAAQPFLRPAWDSEKMGTLRRIGAALSKQIEKTRKRLVRKAARMAAKMKPAAA